MEWHVVQPFRLFKYPSDQKIHEWVFEDVSKDAKIKADFRIAEMERRLNSQDWWQKKPKDSTKTYLELFDDLRRAEERQFARPYVKFEPRLGWASMLRNEENGSPSGGTCWNSRSKSYRGCVSDIGQMSDGNDYLDPKRHMVEMRIMTKTDKGWEAYRGACDYRIETGLKSGYGFLPDPIARGLPEKARYSSEDCARPVFLRTAYKTSYDVKASAGDTELATTVSVKDLMIVGIGDSFASGEGNPEFPAVLDEKNGIKPYIPVEVGGSDPSVSRQSDAIIPTRALKDNGKIKSYTAARWLDDQCHRSIYSAQARAAIALALEGERHHAVTFISYACTGAEITDGLVWPQDSRECTVDEKGQWRLHQPQLSGVVDALGESQRRYRRLDKAIEKTDPYNLAMIAPVARLGTREGLPQLRAKYDFCDTWPRGNGLKNPPYLLAAKLNRKIDALLVSIGGNDIGFAALVSKAVVNSTFFDLKIDFLESRAIRFFQAVVKAINLDEAKRRMGFLKSRFDLLAAAFRSRLEIDDPNRVILTIYPQLTKSASGYCGEGNRGMNVSTFFRTVARASEDTVSSETAAEVVSTLNDTLQTIANDKEWRVANAHVERFKGHSFCDFTTNVTGTRKFAEEMDLPHKKPQDGAEKWAPYNPVTQFYPYEDRTRWVRTFNDTYLLTNFYKGTAAALPPKKRDIGLFQAQRSLGGPMHPTAMGHANMADGIAMEARKLLFVGGEPR